MLPFSSSSVASLNLVMFLFSTRMPSVNDIQSILEKLLENPEFCRLSPQEQQVVVAQYAEQLKRQSLLSTAKPIPNFA